MNLTYFNDLADRYNVPIPATFQSGMNPVDFFAGLAAINEVMLREIDRRIQALPEPLDIGNIVP